MAQGTINTPNYPSNYDNNNHCTWLISSTQRIKLVFTIFSTERGWDDFNVYDGTSTSSSHIGTYGGDLPGQVVENSGEHMFLEFTSDGSVTKQGFLISIGGRPISFSCGMGKVLYGNSGEYLKRNH